MASVNQSLKKAHNRAKQARAAFIAHSDPEYWQKQRQRKENPRIRSYDALTDWIAL